MPFVVPAMNPVNPHAAGSFDVGAQNDSNVASQQPHPFHPTLALNNQSESGMVMDMDISAILPVPGGSSAMFSESGSLNLSNWSSNPIEMSSETAKAMEIVLREIDAEEAQRKAEEGHADEE